ncbi:MAG: insulinase family protein [Candidatus Obscuribacter sp.]|nr:insulinase family protein [Candidatus Obscuribacter sp.]
MLSERDGPYHNAFQLGFDCLENWQSAYTWFVKLRTVSASDVQRVARKYLTSESRWLAYFPALAKVHHQKAVLVKIVAPVTRPRAINRATIKIVSLNLMIKRRSPASPQAIKAKTITKTNQTSPKATNPKMINLKMISPRAISQNPTISKRHKASASYSLADKASAISSGANQTPFGGINLSAYKDSPLTVPGAKHDSRLLLSQGDGAVAAPPEVAQPTGSTTSAARRNVIKKTTLKNGVTVAVLETKVSPSVQIVGAIKAGDAYEPVGKRGVAMLLNRLIGDGSTRYSKVK